MAAIITESHRRELARMFVEDFKNVNNDYYIGIGQSITTDAVTSTDWIEEYSSPETTPFPNGGLAAEKVIKDNLTEIIRVAGTSCDVCIPNFEPESGLYKDYDPFDSSCYYPSDSFRPPFIVNQNTGDIYVLVYNTPGSSINFDSIPAAPALAAFIASSDGGSVWVNAGKTLIGSIVNSNRFKALSPSLDTVTDATEISARREFSGSAVYGFHIANPGSGYQIAPTVVLYGYDENGDQTPLASFSTTIDNATGKLTGISNADILNNLFVTSSTGNDLFVHKGFVNYAVRVQDENATSPAFVYPKIAPKDGFGVNNSDVLPNWYVGFAVNTNTADIVRSVFSKYAQVSLLRNLDILDSEALNAPAYNMLRGIVTTNEITAIARGARITAGSKFIGVVDVVDPANGIIYYVSNHTFGYGSQVSEEITITPEGSSSGIPLTVNSVIEPVIDKNSGHVVFVDNRADITRSFGQNEELKIAIQL